MAETTYSTLYTAPWNGVGQTALGATSAEAIKAGGLDWRVVQRQVSVEGFSTPLKSYRANVREDTGFVLGIVKTGYEVFQNADGFSFMDSVVKEGGARYETAGTLRFGKRVWMLARMPQNIQAAPGDVVKPYILLTNTHDGTARLKLFPTTVRVVCQNTLNLALKGYSAEEGLTIKHTGSLRDRVKAAQAKIGIITARMQGFGEEVAALVRGQMTEAKLIGYFTGLVKDRSEGRAKKVLNHFLTNFENATNTMPGVMGSAWAAYNAVSEFADHAMTVKGKGTERADNRLNSVWFGSGNALKQAAWEAALALAV